MWIKRDAGYEQWLSYLGKAAMEGHHTPYAPPTLPTSTALEIWCIPTTPNTHTQLKITINMGYKFVIVFVVFIVEIIGVRDIYLFSETFLRDWMWWEE